jgi:hypothetical protein
MDLEEAKQRLPPMWTIYDSPIECPGQFVVRVWYGTVCEPTSTQHGTLVEAREWIALQGGSGFFPRSPADSPSIVETWI